MASRIGETLRDARTARGVELEEVERATKIRVKFLAAMEEDRWDELPAPAYARGFLDIYARYLGLDHKALLDEYSRTIGTEHEPIPESVIKPGALGQNRPARRGASIKWAPVAKVAAGMVAVVVAGLIIVGSIGGSSNGGGGAKQNHPKRQAARTTTSSTTPPTSTTPSAEVSVELRATADVWVCLVDESGNPMVDGETLTTDEKRGPFSSAGFDVTFGNGSVELTVDGTAQRVPRLAEPLGYRITPEGVRRLSPSSQPTCA